jgi:SAM-dependent methyltransferase
MDREDRAGRLREAVKNAYSEAAAKPQEEHPFPVGRHFAESLGYPPKLLDDLPCLCADAFSGVSSVSICADIPSGSTVLDLGCGAGLDSLIAARRVGPEGNVIGLDFSATMLARAVQAAEEAGVDNLLLCRADAENLPVRNGTMDVAVVNGIFNLNPKREAIFDELARVVRRGGVVYAAELTLKEPLPADIEYSETDWFA